MQLIIAEKPSVAGEIAKVTGATKKESSYYIGDNNIVSWCVGHLIELAPPENYSSKLKIWSLDTLPIIPDDFKTIVSENTASQFNVLKKLMQRNDVTELVCATDAGREGELIFRLVYEKADCTKPFKRLWISSMEEKSIKDGLASMKNSDEYDNLYKASLCRQRADWLMGINLTRLYTLMHNKVLNTGRVQTPTINLIVTRQADIVNFIPQKYYSLIADLGEFNAKFSTENKDVAQRIVDSKSNATVLSVERNNKKENPPALYDLTTLQRDANRILGFTAKQTLSIAQSLYDKKLATYPRTDSRYITCDMENSTGDLITTLILSGIIDADILNKFNACKVSLERIINDKKVTDHHALLPTEKLSKQTFFMLSTDEKSIMTLLIKRLLVATYEAHSFIATKAILLIDSEKFTATGKEIVENGFKDLVAEADEKNIDILPSIALNDEINVVQITSTEKFTLPPKAFTEDTLLLAMETAGKKIDDDNLKEVMRDCGLGTPATRAGIIENIINNGFIVRDGKKLFPTEVAIKFMGVVLENILAVVMRLLVCVLNAGKMFVNTVSHTLVRVEKMVVALLFGKILRKKILQKYKLCNF